VAREGSWAREAGYGTLIAAGTVWENDCPQGGCFSRDRPCLRAPPARRPVPQVRRKVCNNLLYIGNLAALRQWYVHIRRPFLQAREEGARSTRGPWRSSTADGGTDRELRALAGKMETSIAVAEKVLQGREKVAHLRHKRELLQNWPEVQKKLSGLADDSIGEGGRSLFLSAIDERLSKGPTITSLLSGPWTGNPRMRFGLAAVRSGHCRIPCPGLPSLLSG